jgi:hypothetical protein
LLGRVVSARRVVLFFAVYMLILLQQDIFNFKLIDELPIHNVVDVRLACELEPTFCRGRQNEEYGDAVENI